MTEQMPVSKPFLPILIIARARECTTPHHRVINDLGMLSIPEAFIDDGRPDPVVCKKSFWIHTKTGGMRSALFV